MFDVNESNRLTINLATAGDILTWSNGEVKKPETINYRTLKPEKDGLFCEKIFGPTKDWECYCGKYKRVRFKGIICERCGVEVTRSKVRRERMGHIELAAPVVHIWYLRGTRSWLAYLLMVTDAREERKAKQLEKVIYFAANLVTWVDDEKRHADLPNLEVELGEELAAIEREMELELARRSEEAEKEGAHLESEGAKATEINARKRAWEKEAAQIRERSEAERDVTQRAFDEFRDLFPRKILEDEVLWRQLRERYGEYFRGGMGADAIAQLIDEIDFDEEAVDALFDNGRRGRPVTGPGNRPLKSLSDMLKGKQGRFRQNLLGKRVDYSGRSVIVVGPTLKLHQCGLPKLMALELFKPFVMKRLVDTELAQNIKSAKRMVERRRPQVWDVLEEVIKEHPVLLNRAPTLHRLGIQAFEPLLVEGKAIQIHPLVCAAFNADFDGDQMAVHLPLSAEAQGEARVLMLSSHNMLSPAHGRPLTVPSQDMVIGVYYLTERIAGSEGEGRSFGHLWEVEQAYDSGVISLHAPIRIRTSSGNGEGPQYRESTAGRL